MSDTLDDQADGAVPARRPSLWRIPPAVPSVFLLAIAHSPLLWDYASALARREDYRLFPLFWLLFAGLVWRRGGTPCWRWPAGLLLLADVLLFVAAMWRYSPWMAFLGFACGCLAVLMSTRDRFTGRSLWPLVLLLLATVRLPTPLEAWLLEPLYLAVSGSASRILDLLHVLHVRHGVALELVGYEFVVDRAFGGVHSLFTVCGLAIALAVVFRWHWLVSLGLLLAAAFWAYFWNVIRLVVVALAAANWEQDWTTGWARDVFSWSLVIASLVCLLATERLLMILTAPIIDEGGLALADGPQTLIRWFNAFFQPPWSLPPPDEPAEPAGPAQASADAETENEAENEAPPVELGFRDLLWKAVAETPGFVLVYLFSRPWFLVVPAAPALLGLGLTLLVALWVWAIPEAHTVSFLQTEQRQAAAREDLLSQRISVQALLARRPDAPEHQLAAAQLLREAGDAAAAEELLDQLAPPDRVGYGPAHRRRAEDALERFEQANTDEERQRWLALALHHLKAGGPLDDPRLEYMLGVLSAEDGDLPLAELHLQQAAAQGYGVAHLILSQLERQRGNAAVAETHRQAARESLQTYIRQHPEDREARLGWARCLLDGREWAALDPLLAQLRAAADGARFRDRLGQLHLTAAQQHPLNTPARVQTAVGYAREAFSLLEDPSPAAWQLIQFARVPGTVPRDLLERLRDWRQAAAQDRPDDSRWGLLAAGIAEALGDITAAEVAFRQAAATDPRTLSELASFYRRRGAADSLAETNLAIAAHFEARLRQQPGDSTARIVLAQAYASLGRWREAEQIVTAAASTPSARLTMAGLFVEEYDAWTTRRAQSSGSGAQTGIGDKAAASAAAVGEPASAELLRLALLAVPRYPPAVARWEAALITESRGGGSQLQQRVTELLAAGEAPATMHYLLGSRAFDAQDWPRAVQHWDQARRLRPDDVAVLSRLATALLQTAESAARLGEAETWIERALTLAPGQPALLALRGRIRARLQKDAAAVSDLEAALSQLPGQRELHAILADCYARLGDQELSRVHRELAEPSLPDSAAAAQENKSENR